MTNVVYAGSWTEISRDGTSAPIASTDFNLFTGTVIPSRGFVVVVPDYYDKTWLYSFDEESWSIINTRENSDYHMDCTYASFIGDGVIVYGATGVNDMDTNSISFFDSSEDSWSFLTSQDGPTMRTLVTPIPVNNNNGFLIFGGFKGSFYPPDGSYYDKNYDWYNDLWYYDIPSESWTQLQQNGNDEGPPVLCWYAAVPETSSADNDGFYMFGGGSEFKNIYNDIWYYSYSSSTWQQIANSSSPNAPPPRESTGMFLDEQEQVIYIWGGWGYDFQTKQHTYLRDMWGFYLNTSSWQEINQGSTIPRGRRGFASGWDGNSAYLFGGVIDDYGTTVQDLWRFDP